nr:dynein heavy chain 3, axonemal-like [Halyomorpha halys]
MRFTKSLDGDSAIDIDDQKTILLKEVEYEQNIEVHQNDIERILHYLKEEIPLSVIQPYHEKWLKRARNKIPEHISERLSKLLTLTEEEIRQDYYLSMKVAILDYILTDDSEKNRLMICTYPVRYPAMILRAPVPWHISYSCNSQRFSYCYHLSHPVVTEIRNLFDEFKDMLVIPMSELTKDCNSMTSEEFNLLTDKLCNRARKKIIERWLKAVVYIILDKRETWYHLTPKHVGDSAFLVESFFSSINVLLEKQFRLIITKSIDHYAEIFSIYKGGNKIPDIYEDLMFPRPPMIRICVEPDLGTRNLHLVPMLDDIVELLCSVFSKILHVFDKIPVIEAMLIPEFAENDSYFRRVHSYEKYIHRKIIETKLIFIINTEGPNQYLQIYEPYLYILCGEADKELKQFFEIEPFPFLKIEPIEVNTQCVRRRRISLSSERSANKNTTRQRLKQKRMMLGFITDRTGGTCGDSLRGLAVRRRSEVRFCRGMAARW